MNDQKSTQKNAAPHIGFVVNETAYCMWDVEGTQRTMDLIKSIDPTYFEHIAKIHGDLLEGDEKQYAATALRIAYTQGLETMFALLGALIQAPLCVAGWLLKYQNKDLYDLVAKINDGKPIISQLVDKNITWNSIAALVFSNLRTGDEEKDKRIGLAFAKLWRRFAKDYLDENNIYEYNSLKHGSRAIMGPFHMAMGLEDVPGIPAPPERMETVSYSEFGSSFLIPVKLHDRRNFTVKTLRRNWQPQNLIWGLHFISLSINNILNFIKIIHKEDPRKVDFSYPTNESDFEKPWEQQGGLVVNWNEVIGETDVIPLSEQEIKANFYELSDSSQNRE